MKTAPLVLATLGLLITFYGAMLSHMAYADKPATLEVLEANIQANIDDMRPDLLKKVVKYWTDRKKQIIPLI